MLCLIAEPAWAQLVQRASITTNGALTFTGNALGLDGDAKENGQGTRGAIGTFITTDATLQDVDPPPGPATPFPVGTTSDWRLNRSSARLRLPAGARVVYAELIWGGTPAGSRPEDNITAFLDDPVLFTTPAGVSSVAPDPATALLAGNINNRGTCNACYYVRTANVTTLVAGAGAGVYTVGRVPGTQGTTDNNNNSAGWTLAVIYESLSAPIRSMTLFVGLERSGGSPAPMTGFCTASAGPVSARLAVSAVDGDARSTGDSMLLGPTSTLSTANRLSGPRNPATNFFAGQITDDVGNLDTAGTFGSRNHTPGSPLAGARQSWDIANVDASAQMLNSQTTAFVRGTSNGDTYQITALGLQVDAGGPRLSTAAGIMSVDRATAVLGDVLTYTIVLDNTTGTADAANVVLFDPAPAGTSFVAGSFTANGAVIAGANPATGVPLGVIPAGSAMTVQLQFRVDAIPPGPTSQLRTNQARWTFDFLTCAGLTPQSGAGQSNAVVTQVLVADRRITKTMPATVVAGAAVTYQVAVTNGGPSAGAGAVVTDTNTPALTNVTWTCTTSSGTCAPASGTGPLSSSIALPVGSTATFRVTGTLPPSTPPGTLSGTAMVTVSSGVPDPNAANNIATASAAIATRADIAVTQTGPATVTLGGSAVYTIAVTNRGPSNADSVLVTDSAPAGLTLVSLVGACATAPGCSLPAGGTETVTATFSIPSGYAGPDPIVNVASATSATPDATTGNNTTRVSSSFTASQADVAVTLTDNITEVAAGSITTYVITVTNAGPASAPGTRVTDLFDPAIYADVQWQCAASGTSQCTTAGVQTGDIDTLVSIDPGPANAVVLTAQARVRSDAAGTAENTASVDPADTVTHPNSANNVATDVDTIRAVADLSIAVSGPSVLVPGTTADYVITVANAGPSTARAVTFLEAPEEGVATPTLSGLIESVQAPPDATCANTTVVTAAGLEVPAPHCTIPVLAPLETRTFNVRLAIHPDYPAGIPPASVLLKSVLTLDADIDSDPTTQDRIAVTTASIAPQADVSVVTIGPASIVAGAVATYFIRVANAGPSTAREVVVLNPVPVAAVGLMVVAASGPCAGGFPCRLAALAPGDDSTTRVDLLVPNTYNGPPTFTNLTTVSAGTSDPNGANDSAIVATFIVPEQADLSVDLTAPTVVTPGGPIEYAGRVTNLGPGPAVNITSANVLPGGASFASGSAPGPPTTCDVPATGTSNLVSCLTPLLPVGGVLDFRFVVQTATDLVPGALISSVGSASSPTPDLHSENDRAMVVTRVAVGNQAGLRIASIDTPDPAIVGSEVAYTLTVNNDGPATATNVTVTDTLPAGFTLVSSTPSQGSCTGATCAIGTVAPLATATVTIRAIPAATGLFTNVATVAGTEVDPVLATNTVSETTTVAGPDQADLVIQKFGPTLMPPGESSFYSIEVLNRGPAPALSVEIADPLPAGFRFVANTGDCVTAFPCEFETLEPGASRTIITTFTIDPALATPAVAVNTATIASNGVDDPNLTNNTSSLATTVYPAGTADLFVTNLESPDPVYTGTQLSYFLSIGNRGPSAAPDVTLTDVLPLGVTVISAVSTLGTCTGARVLTCQLGDMPPGSLVRVGILATAPAAVPVPNPMPSVASVTSGAPDPDPGNNQTTQRTTVVPPIPPIAADVSVAIVGPASVRVGQDVTYTLTVTNAGPSPASTVYLDDRALGLTFVSVTGDCVSSFPCALGTLAPGQSRVAVATFAVAANYSGANPIVNTAGVSTTTFDPALANNAATVRTLVGIDVRNEGCGVSSVRSAQTPGRAAPVVSGAPVRLTDFLAYDPPFSGGAFVTCGDVNGDGVPELITGPGPGAAPLVRVLDLRGGSVTELAQFFAYDPAFLGGVLVAAGDVTGDGVAEIVTGAGQGGGPHVRIWSLSGSVVTEIAGFFAYDVALAGGVSVALGDLTGDGVAEIVTGAGPGGGPHVRVWKVTGRTVSEIAGFFAYETAFAGGVWVAVGDVTGDGVAELVTGAGPGGGPHVRVWSLSSGVTEVAGFLAYDPAFPGGARVAVGDLTGDGVAELVTSAGPGGAAHVRVWTVSDGRIAELAGFIAYDPDFAGGATVAVGDVSGDGIAELITGSGSGSTAQVRIWTFDGVRVKETAGFFPYDPAFNGGVSVAVGDVTGDGVADVITGAGPGGGPHVSTWRMNGGPETRSAEFLAYATAFGGGVSVAAGDLTGDGVAEVVTGAGPGGGPHVRVWGLKGSDPPTEVASFFAYDPAFPGGVSVAVGDVTGDGVAELVTGAGPGGGPHVRVWSVIGGRVTEVGGFFSYDPAFRGGVSVAVGDLTGDGIAELVTGAGAGGGPHLRVWSLSGGRITEIAGFFAYDPAFRGGLSVAVGDLDGDGVSELVTGAGPGGSPDVRVWSLDGGGVSELAHFAAYDPLFTGGVFVAVGDIDGNGAGEIITGAGQGGGPHVRVWSINGGGFTAK